MNGLDGRFAARQILGSREAQEDDFGLIEPSGKGTDNSVVLLLADGMGGHIGGDTASSTVVRTFAQTYHSTTGPIPDRLRSCLYAANEAIAKSIEEDPALEGMGSTVVAAVVSQKGMDWISVGDSPLWLFRNGELIRLNADHSMAPALSILVDEGRMTAQEASTDPKRHALRSAVVGDEIPMVDVSSQPVALQKSDCVMLGSDGLFTLDEEVIAETLERNKGNPRAYVADTLIKAVEDARNPRQDNTTVLLYTLDTGTSGSPIISTRIGKVKWLTMSGAIVALALAGYWLVNRSVIDWQTVRGYLQVGGSVSDSTETEREKAVPENETQENPSSSIESGDTLDESRGE